MLIELPPLVKKYKMDIKGIIHVGAHTAEEYPIYKSLGISNVIWIEANEDMIPKIKQKVKGQEVICMAASDEIGETDFYRCTLSSSNSMLEPHLNLGWRDDLTLIDTIKVKTGLIRDIQGNQNFINLDIQGGELKALKGTDLSKLDYIYCEFHKVETYKNCPQIGDLDEYLVDFKIVESHTTHRQWGDMLLIRKTLLK